METQQSDQFGAGMGAGSSATGSASGAGDSGVMGQTKEKAQQLVGEAQEQVTQRLSSSTSQVKGQASGALGNFAEAMRQAAQQFRDQNQGGVAGSLAVTYADRAAEQAQRFGDYLQNTDVKELVQQVERFARRNPGAFLAGTFALGVAGARFLKSSRRQQSQRGDGSAAAGLYTGASGDRDVTGMQPVARENSASGAITAAGNIGGSGFDAATASTSASDTLR